MLGCRQEVIRLRVGGWALGRWFRYYDRTTLPINSSASFQLFWQPTIGASWPARAACGLLNSSWLSLLAQMEQRFSAHCHQRWASISPSSELSLLAFAPNRSGRLRGTYDQL